MDCRTWTPSSQKARSGFSSHAVDPDAAQERKVSPLAQRPRRRRASDEASTVVGGPEDHPPLYWSAFIVNGRSTEMFRLYSNVLFDFIVETWPSDATIGYSQLRNFALYMSLRDVPPPEDWVRRHSKSTCLVRSFKLISSSEHALGARLQHRAITTII